MPKIGFPKFWKKCQKLDLFPAGGWGINTCGYIACKKEYVYIKIYHFIIKILCVMTNIHVFAIKLLFCIINIFVCYQNMTVYDQNITFLLSKYYCFMNDI